MDGIFGYASAPPPPPPTLLLKTVIKSRKLLKVICTVCLVVQIVLRQPAKQEW